MPNVQASKSLAKLFKVDSDLAWAAIQVVRAENGGVASPAAIVDAARDQASPLHPAFEWSNKKAAESYRREQARALVSHFELVFEDGRKMPAMVSVKIVDDAGKRRGYMDTLEALQSSDLRMQVLRQALTGFLALQERYRSLMELGQVFASVKEVATGLGFSDLADKSETLGQNAA